MQLDRPTKRRPRPPNRGPNRDSAQRRTPSTADPFQPTSAFQALQRTGDPFQPRKATPPRSKRLPTAPLPPRVPPTADPFQPPAQGFAQSPSPDHPAVARNDTIFNRVSAFGQPPVPFGQSAGAFVEPSSVGPAASIGIVPPFGGIASTFGTSAPAFGQKKAGAFGKKPVQFGQDDRPSRQAPSSFTQKIASIGRKGMTLDRGPTTPATISARLGHRRMTLDQGADSLGASTGVLEHTSPEGKPQLRTPTRRRLRSSAFPKSSFDYKPATPFRGKVAGEADSVLEQDTDTFQDTPETDRKKGQSAKSNQLLLKSVPLSLFSRASVQRHFSAIPDVHVTHVSLRGSRRPDSRRTALISFSTEQEASIALRNGHNFKGTHLQLSIFRQTAQPHEQAINETNELFFNYVPESLFSEETITDLFDSISDNGVTKVSLKEKPHYGSVKRTAIITFTSTDAAAMALRSLPLYKGRTLTVSFRRTRPQSNNVTASPAGGYDVDDAIRKGYTKSELQEDGRLEQDACVDSSYFDMKPTGYYTMSNGEDEASSYAEIKSDEESTTRLRRSDRQAEIMKLKAAILRKEKERSQMTQGEKGKRERKLAIPKSRETRKQEQPESRSGWRKVGEKVDIKHAISFVGTCMTMCPFKEFEDRVVQRDISLFETDDTGEPSFAKAVKKYRRSAAISEQPSPDEVRPPEVLLDTMEHLKKICDATDAKFADIHNFVRDRTRSLRQDYTLQGVGDESCIKIHEESVRFHILSEHRLYGTDPAVFSSKQNLEQLDKCLISLREMYDLRRDNDLDTSPFEPEMQAYYILTQMSDPRTCVQLCTGFAQEVRCSQPVQFALQVVRAASEGFGSFTRYFSLVRSAPYLMACLMHSRFSAVRVRALAVINVTHGNPSSKDNIPASVLAKQLGFESDKEAEDFCRTLGMQVENVMMPSTGSEVITIRTPSEPFDEAKVSEWESSRADILIESKAQGFKTSEIIQGNDRKDFKLGSLAKKPSEQVAAKKRKASVSQTLQFPPPLTGKPLEITGAVAGLPTFSKAMFSPKVTPVPRTEFPLPPKEDLPPASAHMKPQEDRRKYDDLFKVPQSLPLKSTFPKSPKQQRAFQFTPKPLSLTPKSIFDVTPPFSGPKLETNAVSTGFPSGLQTTSLELKDSRSSLSPTDGLLESGKDLPIQKLQVPPPVKPQEAAIESSRKGSPSPAVSDEKTALLELEKAARHAALKTLLTNLVDASEADLEKARKIIHDAQSGTLKFPKAMEIWDDAKDILLAVSERTERGLRELEGEDSLGLARSHADDAEIEDLRERLRLCSHEGTELLDQLDEVFSKSLAVATAHLRLSGPNASSLSRTPQIPPTLHQLSALAAYGLDDEDVHFESKEVPDRGAEVRSVLNAMNDVGLPRWQAVIADMTGFQTGGDEVGIAKRWLRQRLSVGDRQDSSSLCDIESTESGPPSISIREVREVSRIPYTADFVVLPCDIRTMELDPSGAWTSLERVLRKNRSFALSYDIPPPSIVVLYYCGSSDMPLWFTDERSTGKSLATFHKRLQDKGYVATCQKLELPRTTAFQSMECESFTDAMNKSVRASAQSLAGMGNVARMTNLRDHLVHVANRALGAVLGSTPLQGDAQAALHIIHKINESWRDVTRRLRREEARWPEEMAERRRLADAYTRIESELQLPLPRKGSLITDYIGEMAAIAGVGIPTNQYSEGVFWFSSALGHLMNAFVRQSLIECPVSVVYLAPESREDLSSRKVRPTEAYLLSPSKLEERKTGVTSTYTPWTAPQRKTKRLRDEASPSDSCGQGRYPLRRRLSVVTADRTPVRRLSSEFGAKRRRSLPASYGRRRMFELLDGICSEEQAFDDLIEATMEALTSKRRRLEQRGEMLAT